MKSKFCKLKYRKTKPRLDQNLINQKSVVYKLSQTKTYMILIWYLNFINQNIENLSRDQTKIWIEQYYFEYKIFMHVLPHAKVGIILVLVNSSTHNNVNVLSCSKLFISLREWPALW